MRDEAVKALLDLDREIGQGWFRHAKLADATDEFLHVPIADGMFSTKIDGFSHAARMTTPFILKYMQEQDARLNITAVTAWKESVNSAIRYAQWQVDFHWKIDTRVWQYMLYMKFMRLAYRDAVNGSELEAEEKTEFLDAAERFWDEVEVAYTYRSEIIERARGFKPHPDPTAGAKDHGYVYRQLLPTPDRRFDQLKFELIGPDYGAGTATESVVPEAWPGLSAVEPPPLLRAALRWYSDAKAAGLADEWLCVALGARMVPTRSNGWEAGLVETSEFLVGDESRVVMDAEGDAPPLEVRASMFARAQYCFALRLEGVTEQYLRLIELQAAALRSWHAEDRVDVDAFLSAVGQEYRQLTKRGATESDVRDTRLARVIESTRPVHPRYAPFDPLEPLPWQTRSPERYLARMKRLGYTL